MRLLRPGSPNPADRRRLSMRHQAALAKQIEQGAPADIFSISIEIDDYLDIKKLDSARDAA